MWTGMGNGTTNGLEWICTQRNRNRKRWTSWMGTDMNVNISRRGRGSGKMSEECMKSRCECGKRRWG